MQEAEPSICELLFSEFREDFASLVVAEQHHTQWSGEDIPPIRFLLQQKTERKINQLIERLDYMVLSGQAVLLAPEGEGLARADLLGHSENTGLSILAVNNNLETEQQTLGRLLAQLRYFAHGFPGLQEWALNAILICPMGSKAAKDSYACEVIENDHNILALIPDSIDFRFFVYYPEPHYYQLYEQHLLDDRSFITLVISFPAIEGWIDTDLASLDRRIPDYSRAALNAISGVIASTLEANGVDALVYAAQQWSEISYNPLNPNSIVVAAVNPFSCTKPTNKTLQPQLHPEEQDRWLYYLETSYQDNLIKTVVEQFELCFHSNDHSEVDFEIHLPDWAKYKSNISETVFKHNLDIRLTGVLREIYHEYVRWVYQENYEPVYYADQVPRFSYEILKNFLATWEIMLSLRDR